MGSGRVWCRAVVAGTILFVVVWALWVGSAHAWQASNLVLVSQVEDRFWNYDCEVALDYDPSVCDWPVTIVFWGNASVDKVKQALGASLPIYGNEEYLGLQDKRKRGRWWWVADRGVKSFSFTQALHMRLYADPDGHLTNGVWGDYVVATTHYDLNELSTNPTFGRSEEAAAAIEALCVQAYGRDAVEADVLPLFNAEPDRVEQRANSKGGVDSHHWQCDGLASMVYVP